MLEPFFIRTEVKKEKVLKKVDPMQVARLSTVRNYTHNLFDRWNGLHGSDLPGQRIE